MKSLRPKAGNQSAESKVQIQYKLSSPYHIIPSIHKFDVTFLT